MNILLCITGSVAVIKVPELFTALSELGTVKVAATESAMKMANNIRGYNLVSLPWFRGEPGAALEGYGENKDKPRIPIFTDKDEWVWKNIGDPVLHIDLKEWADVLVIAPLTANTLSKVAYGICDNLVTCIYRAWPQSEMVNRGKPIVIAPAMNTDMWNNGHTSVAIDRLRSFQHKLSLVLPVRKKLACGTMGIGAMADSKTIARFVRETGEGRDNG